MKVLFIKGWEIPEHDCVLGRSTSSRKGEDDNGEDVSREMYVQLWGVGGHLEDSRESGKLIIE